MKLNDRSIINCYVEVIKLNFKPHIKLKFENIGLYQGTIIKVLPTSRFQHNQLFQIDKIVYGIRKKDAQYIEVKKAKP